MTSPRPVTPPLFVQRGSLPRPTKLT